MIRSFGKEMKANADAFIYAGRSVLIDYFLCLPWSAELEKMRLPGGRVEV